MPMQEASIDSMSSTQRGMESTTRSMSRSKGRHGYGLHPEPAEESRIPLLIAEGLSKVDYTSDVPESMQFLAHMGQTREKTELQRIEEMISETVRRHGNGEQPGIPENGQKEDKQADLALVERVLLLAREQRRKYRTIRQLGSYDKFKLLNAQKRANKVLGNYDSIINYDYGNHLTKLISNTKDNAGNIGEAAVTDTDQKFVFKQPEIEPEGSNLPDFQRTAALEDVMIADTADLLNGLDKHQVKNQVRNNKKMMRSFKIAQGKKIQNSPIKPVIVVNSDELLRAHAEKRMEKQQCEMEQEEAEYRAKEMQRKHRNARIQKQREKRLAGPVYTGDIESTVELEEEETEKLSNTRRGVKPHLVFSLTELKAAQYAEQASQQEYYTSRGLEVPESQSVSSEAYAESRLPFVQQVQSTQEYSGKALQKKATVSPVATVNDKRNQEGTLVTSDNKVNVIYIGRSGANAIHTQLVTEDADKKIESTSGKNEDDAAAEVLRRPRALDAMLIDSDQDKSEVHHDMSTEQIQQYQSYRQNYPDHSNKHTVQHPVSQNANDGHQRYASQNKTSAPAVRANQTKTDTVLLKRAELQAKHGGHVDLVPPPVSSSAKKVNKTTSNNNLVPNKDGRSGKKTAQAELSLFDNPMHPLYHLAPYTEVFSGDIAVNMHEVQVDNTVASIVDPASAALKLPLASLGLSTRKDLPPKAAPYVSSENPASTYVCRKLLSENTEEASNVASRAVKGGYIPSNVASGYNEQQVRRLLAFRNDGLGHHAQEVQREALREKNVAFEEQYTPDTNEQPVYPDKQYVEHNSALVENLHRKQLNGYGYGHGSFGLRGNISSYLNQQSSSMNQLQSSASQSNLPKRRPMSANEAEQYTFDSYQAYPPEPDALTAFYTQQAGLDDLERRQEIRRRQIMQDNRDRLRTAPKPAKLDSIYEIARAKRDNPPKPEHTITSVQTDQKLTAQDFKDISPALPSGKKVFHAAYEGINMLSSNRLTSKAFFSWEMRSVQNNKL